jgi:hypothetical protein
MAGQGLVKVQFYDADVGYENLWAAKLNADQYRLESIPFFIYGIARGDLVTAQPDKDGRLQFIRVVAQSGNRTLRARSDDLINDADRCNLIVEGLKGLGCDVEVHRSRLIAINLPPTVSLEAVANYLITNDLSWEYGHPQNLNK